MTEAVESSTRPAGADTGRTNGLAPPEEAADTRAVILGNARVRLPAWLWAGAPAWIWIGLGVTAVGFLVLTLGWGGVAGETQVYRQLPYLASAVPAGLALVVIGCSVVNVVTRQRDGKDRDRQIERLLVVLEELRSELEDGRSR